MGVGEGDDKGSGPRRWEMYLALETCCQMIHLLSYLQGGTFEESRWKWQGRCMHG